MRTQLVLIFWNKIAGRADNTRCSCFDSTKYTCVMGINHFCLLCSVFEDDESSEFESRQFSGVMRVMFLRENDKINEIKETDVRNEVDELPLSHLNCDIPLGMSNNRP